MKKKKKCSFYISNIFGWISFYFLYRLYSKHYILSVWNIACILEIDFLLLCDYDKLLWGKETGHLQHFSHGKLSVMLTTWKIKRKKKPTSCEQVIIRENTKMCADMCVLLYAHLCLCTLYGVFLKGRITASG